MKIDNGSAVMVLCEYNLVPATVAKIGRGKNIKVEIPAGHGLSAHTKYVPLEKVAEVDEKICIVWEAWRGVNGRGSYRIERELYPDIRREAGDWPYQVRLTETAYGVWDQNLPHELDSNHKFLF